MILTALLFIALGLIVKNGKAYNLIAGYNTLPKKEKAKYDIEGIASVFRNAMFGMAFIITLGYFISIKTEIPNVKIYALFIAVILGIPYLLLRSNAEKFKK